MAEETKAAETQEQQAEQATEQVDWQAKYEAMRQHARDWEKQAKANEGAEAGQGEQGRGGRAGKAEGRADDRAGEGGRTR